MKKKILIPVSIVLALALLLGGAFLYVRSAKPFHTGDLTGTAAQYPYEGRETAPMEVRDTGAFVILQFTDTHFTTGKGKDAKTLKAIGDEVDRVRPDLVVITGDMLEGHNSLIFYDKQGATDAIAEMFEHREQPWAYVPGNNDCEYLGTSEDVAAYLAKNYEYCILSNEPGPDGVAPFLTGATQYAIPLLYADGTVAHELLFMDSLGRDPDTNYLTYGYFKQDQANWLEGQLMALKEEAPLARASVFFHGNTPAFSDAFEEVWRNTEGSAVVDEAMARAGNVGLVSIGHIHPPVNWLAYLGRTYYQVVRASGYSSTKTPGGVMITIYPGDGNPQRQYSFEEVVF